MPSSNPSSSMYPVAKLTHSIGKVLLEDDASDIGYLVYHGRKGHYYHGKNSPDHPGVLHHWMVGSALMFVGHIWGVIEVAKEAKRVEEEVEEMLEQEEELVVQSRPQITFQSFFPVESPLQKIL